MAYLNEYLVVILASLAGISILISVVCILWYQQKQIENLCRDRSRYEVIIRKLWFRCDVEGNELLNGFDPGTKRDLIQALNFISKGCRKETLLVPFTGASKTTYNQLLGTLDGYLTVRH